LHPAVSMIDLAIVLAFVLYGVAAGLRARKQASTDLTEYFLAGRSLGGVRAGLSMAATQFSADTPLLVMGLLAVGGAFSLWRLWVYGLAFLLMGFVLGSAWRRAGVLTDAELAMVRYSSRGAVWLRALKAVYYGTVINCVVMAFVLVAAVRIFEIFLPWHEWLSPAWYAQLQRLVAATGVVLASGAAPLDPIVATTNNAISIVAMLSFVTLYSTTGGIRSVVATDVVQLTIMMLGTAAYAYFATTAAGGLDRLPEVLATVYGDDRADRFLSFAPTLEEALVPFLIVLSLQWLFQVNSDGTGYLAQRTMACRDAREARIAAVVFTFTQILARSLLWLVIGLALLVVYPFDATVPLTDALVGERELTFARGMDELLPPGVRGLMLTGMLAALASTLDTHLNWGASYWCNDLYKGIWVERIRKRTAGRGELVLVARLSNLVVLAIALAIMANLGSIQQAWQMSLLFGAGTGAVLVLRWLWERVNLYSEVGSIVVSLILAPILLLTVETDWLRLATMAGVSSLVVLLTAWLFPETEIERRVHFFRTVRPLGWWPRTARAAGVDARAPLCGLLRALGALVACAATVYCWLVGVAALLLDGSATHGVLLMAAGSAAAFYWVGALRSQEPFETAGK
jgi:SSS family solute:Na+ symporter